MTFVLQCHNLTVAGTKQVMLLIDQTEICWAGIW